MTPSLIESLEDSRIVQALAFLLRKIFRALGESRTGHIADSLARAVRSSRILGLLFFAPPVWAELSERSPILRALARRYPPAAEGSAPDASPIRWALWGLLLFVPVELYLITRLPTDIKYLSDVLVVGTAGLLLVRSPSRGWAYRSTPLDLPIAALLAVGLLSGFVNGESFKFWIFGMRAYLEYALVYFLVAAAPLSEGDRRQLVVGVVLLGVFLALVGVAQQVLHVATPRSWIGALGASQGIRTRVFGTMGNPNTFAGYLVMLIALLGAFTVTDGLPPWLKTIAAFGLLPALFSLLFTYSREALLALVAVGIVIGVVAEPRALVVLVAGAALALLGDPKLLTHLLSAFSQTYTSVSLSWGRLYFWAKSLLVISQHPVLGVGPGLFGGSVAYDFKSPVLLHYGLSRASTIDSEWMQVAAEMGILGLLAYLWILSAIVRTSVTAYMRDADPFFRAVSLAAAGAAAGFAVQSVFAGLFEVHQVVLMLWFLAGVAAWRWRITKGSPAIP